MVSTPSSPCDIVLYLPFPNSRLFDSRNSVPTTLFAATRDPVSPSFLVACLELCRGFHRRHLQSLTAPQPPRTAPVHHGYTAFPLSSEIIAGAMSQYFAIFTWDMKMAESTHLVSRRLQSRFRHQGDRARSPQPVGNLTVLVPPCCSIRCRLNTLKLSFLTT